MKVLAIDTSSAICSVAVIDGKQILSENHDHDMREHSTALMPMVKKTLEDAKLTLDDLDMLACGIGPGSFTGIRIGIATIKAFNDTKGTPAIGINSLEAQAYTVMMESGVEDCKILSMIDARNDNAYFAVYRMHEGNLTVFKNPEVTNLSEIPQYINFQEKVYIVGDVELERIETYLVAERSQEYAQGKEVKDYKYVKPSETMAEAIAFAAQNKFRLGIRGDSNTLSPMYLRKPQAERNLIGLKDDAIKVNKMTQSDYEWIIINYKLFPNLWEVKEFIDDRDTNYSEFLIARQNEDIVGFIAIKKVFDELEVVNIVTRADKRQQGIGSNLLSYIIRKYADMRKINLEVGEHNIVAKNLYCEFGFRPVGRRENYYKDHDDAILMSL